MFFSNATRDEARTALPLPLSSNACPPHSGQFKPKLPDTRGPACAHHTLQLLLRALCLAHAGLLRSAGSPFCWLLVQVKKENPGVSFGEVGKILGQKWKAISDSEKTKFEEMAKKDKVPCSAPWACLLCYAALVTLARALPARSGRDRGRMQFLSCAYRA